MEKAKQMEEKMESDVSGKPSDPVKEKLIAEQQRLTQSMIIITLIMPY